jgi:hypothetical protein
MVGSAALPEFDWTLIKALGTPELVPELPKEVAKVDPLRAEALAHAARVADAKPVPASPLGESRAGNGRLARRASQHRKMRCSSGTWLGGSQPGVQSWTCCTTTTHQPKTSEHE